MFLGAACLGVHMAMTHSITISMIAAYQPTGMVPGLGKITGTAVSFTDLLLGEPRVPTWSAGYKLSSRAESNMTHLLSVYGTCHMLRFQGTRT